MTSPQRYTSHTITTRAEEGHKEVILYGGTRRTAPFRGPTGNRASELTAVSYLLY